MRYMTEQEIEAFEPDAMIRPDLAIGRARQVIGQAGYWSANQQMGRRWAVGCVALEITQRCNLDCTLCYLSENSESVRDMPLEEVFRRIDLVHRHFGGNTDVQVTGGEPTLRKHDELLAIVRRILALGMRPTLMTNGIRATRPLLERLAQAGLVDVAFHVDTTQHRKGYADEAALNEIRRAYLERSQGLPLLVIFNTTVHPGNFHEIPDLVRFFRAHAGAVRTASFQLAADTGRGVQRETGTAITPESVAKQIEIGADVSINFLASLVGHPACNRYGMCLEAGGKLFDAFDDPGLVGRTLCATAHLDLQRNDVRSMAKRLLGWLAANPAYLLPALAWAGKKAWAVRKSLIAAKGRVRTISFVIHNFMGGRTLERDRIDACVFKVMTAHGPLSMCLHNAKRDRFILQPVRVHTRAGERFWQPLSGEVTPSCESPGNMLPERKGMKYLKGRFKEQALEQRHE